MPRKWENSTKIGKVDMSVIGTNQMYTGTHRDKNIHYSTGIACYEMTNPLASVCHKVNIGTTVCTTI